MKKKLTHLDESGNACMVDIAGKPATFRRAVAFGRVIMKKETLDMIVSGNVPKGDVPAAARIAGIMAAKKTSGLIPMCHPISLTSVKISLEPCSEAYLNDGSVAVSSAGLTTGDTPGISCASSGAGPGMSSGPDSGHPCASSGAGPGMSSGPDSGHPCASSGAGPGMSSGDSSGTPCASADNRPGVKGEDAYYAAICIRAVCETCDKTGVEMEALAAVSVAALTVYDMCKAVDRGMIINEVRLMEKEGGASGLWQFRHGEKK